MELSKVHKLILHLKAKCPIPFNYQKESGLKTPLLGTHSDQFNHVFVAAVVVNIY